MTPERARELSQQAWNEMDDCKEWNAPLIKAILQACAEEREACANELEHGMSDEQGHHKQYAKAIRGGA